MDGVFFEENSNEFAKKFAVQCHDKAMKNLSPHSLTVSMLFIGITCLRNILINRRSRKGIGECSGMSSVVVTHAGDNFI